MVALVYNWWNPFVRLAEPDKHLDGFDALAAIRGDLQRGDGCLQFGRERMQEMHAGAGLVLAAAQPHAVDGDMGRGPP